MLHMRGQLHLSSSCCQPFSCSTLPLVLGSLDLLPRFLVNAGYVIIRKNLAVNNRLLCERFSLLELGPLAGFLIGPLPLSRLFLTNCCIRYSTVEHLIFLPELRFVRRRVRTLTMVQLSHAGQRLVQACAQKVLPQRFEKDGSQKQRG